MDILVLGGAGFIGRHLCAALDKRGHDVTVLSRSPDPDVLPDGVAQRQRNRLRVDHTGLRGTGHGRSPEHLRIFTALAPIVVPTEEEAQQKYEELAEYVSYEGALALVGGWTDIDFAEFDPDQRVEHIESDAIQEMVDSFTKADPDREWTVREVAKFIGVGGIGVPVIGTLGQ